MFSQEMKVFFYWSEHVENCSGFLEYRMCPLNGIGFTCRAHSDQAFIGVTPVSGWSKPIRSRPSKLSRHGERRLFSSAVFHSKLSANINSVSSEVLPPRDEPCLRWVFSTSVLQTPNYWAINITAAIRDSRMSKKLWDGGPPRQPLFTPTPFAIWTFPYLHTDIFMIKTVKKPGVGSGLWARNHSHRRLPLHDSGCLSDILSQPVDREISVLQIGTLK